MSRHPDMLDYHDALKALLDTHQPLSGEERVPLAQLDRRVLARAIPVQADVPAFDNSAMDGYAICGNDAEAWQVVARIAAGMAPKQMLSHGQAARVFTGAPVPPGTTAVLMQEEVIAEAGGEWIRCREQPVSGEDMPAHSHIKPGQYIRRRAEELQKGAPLLPAGLRMTPAIIGLLAGQGYTDAPCIPRVRVTVFSSGNELVEPGTVPQPGQIVDINRVMLNAMLRAQGLDVADGGILPDDLTATRSALARAAADTHAILCSGGVSVGEEDHLKAALSEVGELTQWRLFIKPGKPFTWGRIGACRVLMLPGNPVSSFVTLQLLAMPALRRMSGLSEHESRPWRLSARAAFTSEQPEPRREFLRVNLANSPEGLTAEPLAKQGSAMLSGAAFAQALAEIPPGAIVTPGQLLDVYPLAERFGEPAHHD